jgi:ketosteroid isomerase-like protein
MLRPRLLFYAASAAWLTAAVNASAQQPDSEALAAQAVVRSFHDALRRGDAQAAQVLLAADAVILEGGHMESREEYLKHHLSADIEFAKAVPSRTTRSEATVSGQTAWVRSATSSQGKFRNSTVNLSGVELVVLTRTSAGWEIRAVHWSSSQVK